jgi:arylamine N-acetyltransferase
MMWVGNIVGICRFRQTCENLDIQLERPVDQDIERIFDKIVRNGRGGWCFELNGPLQWALEEIGFDVTRCVADENIVLCETFNTN